LAKTRANCLTKGAWPILTNRFSIKQSLNALRNLGAPTHQTNLLTNNRTQINRLFLRKKIREWRNNNGIKSTDQFRPEFQMAILIRHSNDEYRQAIVCLAGLANPA
jgi:hypothetical protein